MNIKQIQLETYRNYEKQTLEFHPRLNVLFGGNAQGKTNLLESIYLCSAGRSHRTTADRDLIAFSAEKAAVKLDFEAFQRPFAAELFLEKGHAKRIRINQIPVQKLSELPSYLKCVLFSPEELELVKEGPDVRRHFLDVSISALRPNYMILLQNYNLVLKHKNNLLKAIKKNPQLIKTLPVWNEKLAEYGSKLVVYREIFINLLKKQSGVVHQNITEKSEELTMEYKSVDCNRRDEKEIFEAFLRQAKRLQQAEIERCATLWGAHRDDLLLFINGYEAKKFASQGQQRTIVLSLKLALTEIIKEDIGEYPILLLDDIMSELDQQRRLFLMEKIKHQQVFITCTDVDRIGNVADAFFFEVAAGHAKRV